MKTLTWETLEDGSYRVNVTPSGTDIHALVYEHLDGWQYVVLVDGDAVERGYLLSRSSAVWSTEMALGKFVFTGG